MAAEGDFRSSRIPCNLLVRLRTFEMPSVSTIGSSKRRYHNSLRLRELVGPLARSRRRDGCNRATWFHIGSCRMVGQYRQAATDYGLTQYHATFSLPLLYFLGTGKRSISMATQIVMDHTSNIRHYFNADDTEAPRSRGTLQSTDFRRLFRGWSRDAAGDVAVTRSFDPGAEETLFIRGLLAAD